MKQIQNKIFLELYTVKITFCGVIFIFGLSAHCAPRSRKLARAQDFCKP
jgi:hypothetical protein